MNTKNTFRGEFEVEFKGKKHSALFTMNAIRLILNGEGIKLEKFEEWIAADPLTAIPSIAYYSVLNWHVQNGKKFGANKEMFIAQILDGGDMEAVTEAIGAALSTGDEPEGKK
jgi:hypothetical protein